MVPFRSLALATLLLTPLAATAAPLTFTIEAQVSGIDTANPALPDTQAFLSARYPAGTPLTLTFTLETATAAGPGAGEYRGIVTGRSGSLGGDALATSTSPATCLNEEIECRISTFSFLSTTLLFLAGGLVDIEGLQADAATAGLATASSLIGEAFLTLRLQTADVDTSGGLSFDPADIDVAGSGGGFTIYSFLDFELYRTVLELDFLRIYAGAPVVSAVPAPATFVLLATGLLGLGLRRRRG